LWGLPIGPQVCTSSPSLLTAVLEVARTPQPGTPAGVTAFVDVNVVPMDTERVLANQTVLVEGGRITALGPASQVKVPAGAIRIDGRGKYLIPGLADMHAHIPGSQDTERHLFSWVAHGVTTTPDFVMPWVLERRETRRIWIWPCCGSRPAGAGEGRNYRQYSSN
jgi:hypothetical protein